MSNLVSVIITTYKRPYGVLLRAVQSVLNQSYENLEIIIIDDSPNDDPNRKEVEMNIRNLNDSRVKYIQHKSNQGACKARNTGIEASKGEYVAFLDDDDEWIFNKIELQLEKFVDKQVGLVYCDSFTIILRGNEKERKVLRANRVSGMVYDKLILWNFIGSTSFVMLKKESLEFCGGFNNELKASQDFELWLRISKYYKVDYVDIPLVNYYIHEGERISANVDNKIQGLEKINELNLEYLKLKPRVNSIRKLKLIPYYAMKSGYKQALKKWFYAVKIYPFHRESLIHFAKIFYYNNKKSI
ncbi:glycosyltransferase family 2 protein [Alkalihalobacillus trypoxylicola]|uniref:Glycosyltransferase 2-like domain-containing protein n=1 Tax=Alkalihalobacillus trypoxylicola TaxID=519424 RepID=A0A161QKQ4_9BACI|nr:glycosyltransferase family 2 protein [Alkalihalobacillus trypoxylicola]KYG30593.1 hypothetical protein AZF04_19290 [Alkalihalobacillus trypoxylicola]